MSARHTLLLVQPQFLLRRTVASVAREMQLAQVREASSVAAAQDMLVNVHVDGILIDLDDADPAFELVQRVRDKQLCPAAGLPIAAMASACDPSMALRLRDLRVQRLLLKPFKVKSVLEVVAGLW